MYTQTYMYLKIKVFMPLEGVLRHQSGQFPNGKCEIRLIIWKRQKSFGFEVYNASPLSQLEMPDVLNLVF